MAVDGQLEVLRSIKSAHIADRRAVEVYDRSGGGRSQRATTGQGLQESMDL